MEITHRKVKAFPCPPPTLDVIKLRMTKEEVRELYYFLNGQTNLGSVNPHSPQRALYQLLKTLVQPT